MLALNIMFWLVVISILVMTVVYIWKVSKNERQRREFSKVMKVGDSVDVPIISGRVSGQIHSIDGDLITITITANKSRVYPNG